MNRPLRIAQVAPPMERVPPRAYGGTERVVYELVRELDRRGYDVTTFASGDSEVPGRHVVTVPEALRPTGYTGDAAPYFYLTMMSVVERAKDFAIKRSVQKQSDQEGISLDDLQRAVRVEYKENEIFPKTDTQEDWLKLLDYEPENVVHLKPIRNRPAQGGPRRTII